MKIKKPAPKMYEKKEKSVSYGTFAKTKRPKDFVPLQVVSTGYNPRETTKYQSLSTKGLTGGIKVGEVLVYTGGYAKGVSLMHKSCYQPVFSDQEAIEHAQMRR